MPEGGTYAPDGRLYCAPCTGTLKSEAASMVIATETRRALERKQSIKSAVQIGAVSVAGVGTAYLVVAVLIFVALTAIAARFSGCSVPRWFDVG
jgi:hypothetical protein